MTELTGGYVTVEGARTYYEAVGDESAPAVVCVHTAGAEGRQWQHAAPLLAERGYRAVVPDLPGHGKSYPVDWEPHSSIHAHAEFVWSLVGELGLERPAVVGCSIGGDTALDLAVHHADDLRGVVAMEGLGRTRGPPMAELAHPHACPGWENVMDASVVDSTADGCPDERLRELRWQHRNAQSAAANDLQGWADFDVMDRLDRATCPVMLVRGEADFFIQPDVFEETADRLPDCEPVVLDGIGHYPMMEDPELTADLIVGFLDGID